MYLPQILWLIAFPLSIFIAYRLVILVLKKYEKKISSNVEINSNQDS